MLSDDEENFSVDTMPAKEVVVTSLTKDASVEECIFDLLDNAIDGARNQMEKLGKVAVDPYGLPSSYLGYCVKLEFSGTGVTIQDNCGGIRVPDLREIALRFGERSSHSFGIGTYGVGLNRAIFRLGRATELITDDGTRESTINLDNAKYLASRDWSLPAKSVKSRHEAGTTIRIQKPPPPVARDFASSRWLEKLKSEIERRYFAFLLKGLEIRINDEKLNPRSIPLREDGLYAIQKKSYEELDGVKVFMTAGQHREYRLTKEAGFDLSVTRTLTGQFGWNVICNDRAILISDRSAKTGWETSWHPEYNGFVGYIWFVSNDPEKLPWNTKKTDIDASNKVYAMALEGMRELAGHWRTFNRKIRKTNGDASNDAGHNRSTESEGTRDTKKTKAEAKPSGSKKTATSTVAQRDHLEYSTVLPLDVGDKQLTDKLFRLVIEAKSLDMSDHLYSGLLLLRALFEMASIDYLKRRRYLKRMKEFHFEHIDSKRKAENRSPLSAEEKHNYSPNFEDICVFFLQNGDVWGVQDFNYLKHALDKLKSNKKTLNGVAHNPYGMLTLDDAKRIREATVPLLRHLLS